MSTPLQQPTPLSLVTVGCLAMVYVVWGSTYLAIRYTLDSVPPFLLGGSRFLVAGGLLFFYLVLRKTRLPTLAQWRDGAIVGVLLLAIGNGGVVLAEGHVPSGLAAMFIGASPLVATLWAGLFGDWPRGSQWVGLIVGLAGVVILISGTQLKSDPTAMMYLLAADIAWTLGSVLAQKRLRLAPGAMGFATEMITGGALMMLLSRLTGEHLSGPILPSAAIAWLFLVVAGSLLAFSAYMHLLATVSTPLAMSYGYVNPLVALMLGAAMRGEHLTFRELVASAVIIGGVLMLALAPRRVHATILPESM